MQRHHSNSQKRIGSAFLELIVSSVAASFLIVGMGSAVFLTVEAYDASEPVQTDNLATQAALQRLSHDLAEAVEFSEQTANAITFTVPDRTGDGNDDTLRYTWGGEDGDPLQLSLNGGTPVTLLEEVQNLDFMTSTRDLIGETLARTSIESNTLPHLDSFTEATTSTDAEQVTVELPGGVLKDDVLIAFVVVDGSHASTLDPEESWDEVHLEAHASGDLTVGCWRRKAKDDEPSTHTFTWTGAETAIATIFHCSHAHKDSPIHLFVTDAGTALSPVSPGLTTTINNTLILRLLGVDQNSVYDDLAGIDRSLVINANASGSTTNDVSMISTISPMPFAGTVAGDQFLINALLIGRPYVSITLAIKED